MTRRYFTEYSDAEDTLLKMADKSLINRSVIDLIELINQYKLMILYLTTY